MTVLHHPCQFPRAGAQERHDPALRPRPLPGFHRLNRRAGFAQYARSGAARRRVGLCALLGGRAPQYAGDREFRPRHHDRADRRGNLAHAHRVRRRDAAQPRAADGGRALQGAGGALSRPHRPRPWPRARHRPGDVLRAAPPPGHQRGGRFPRALQRIDAAGDARLSRRPSVPQCARHALRRAAAADFPARLVGLQRAACRADRRGLCLCAPFRAISTRPKR